MAKLNFKLVTPERTVLSEEVDSLSCPTVDGQITVLPHHIPLIAPLAAGELIAHVGIEKRHIAITGGFVEVRPDNQIIILSDAAEHAHEIDEQRAEEARKRAEESMKNKQTLSDEEYAQVAAALQRSMARLKVVKKSAHRGHHGVGSEGVLPDVNA
jgi:F-type H+-transporting ATPase subunit epsilon